MKLDTFTQHYIIAALWSENDNSDPETGGEPLDKNYDVEDIHPDSIAKMAADCKKFQDENAELLTDENCLTRIPMLEQAGHDFWLTRNHHGCGFWETSDWEKEAGKKLTAAAHKFGDCHLYVENGQVYCE